MSSGFSKRTDIGFGVGFSAVAPDIDYRLRLHFTTDASGSTTLNITGEHNKFPFYEILVGGASVHSWSAPGETGPGLWNLGMAWTNVNTGPIQL